MQESIQRKEKLELKEKLEKEIESKIWQRDQFNVERENWIEMLSKIMDQMKFCENCQINLLMTPNGNLHYSKLD